MSIKIKLSSALTGFFINVFFLITLMLIPINKLEGKLTIEDYKEFVTFLLIIIIFGYYLHQFHIIHFLSLPVRRNSFDFLFLASLFGINAYYSYNSSLTSENLRLIFTAVELVCAVGNLYYIK
jgi:O-antigen ligase